MTGRPNATWCTRCGGVKTVRADGICLPCVTKENAERMACNRCGESTRREAEDGMCWDCYVYVTTIATALAGTDPALGLGEGEWRYDPARHAQVWVPKFPVEPSVGEAPKRPDNKSGPKVPEASHAQARTQPCRHCRAQPGQPCRQSNGAVYSKGTHRARRAAAEAVLGVAS